MKKILALLLAVVMVLGMVACASKTEAPAETTTTEPAAETTTEETKTEEPAKEEETATEEQPTEGVIKKVALVTDVGTIDDESFNQATWQGVKAYCEANGIEYTYYQPTEDSTDARCISIDQAIKEGASSSCPAICSAGPSCASRRSTPRSTSSLSTLAPAI